MVPKRNHQSAGLNLDFQFAWIFFWHVFSNIFGMGFARNHKIKEDHADFCY